MEHMDTTDQQEKTTTLHLNEFLRAILREKWVEPNVLSMKKYIKSEIQV